ncbi:hypothetical protein LCGC14_2907180, partial [marine sediment metagenome]
GQGLPETHTELKGGFAEHKPGYEDPYANGCTLCHGPNLDDGYAPSCFSCHGAGGEGLPADHTELKGGFAEHKPGYDDPYANGCTLCHGPNLNDGVAPSCFGCHGPGGQGPPSGHTDVKSDVLLSVAHKTGAEDPFTNGCTECHGPNLNDGFAPSCFTCHRSEWDDHNFSAEPWLPEGTNHCHVCHLPPTYNGGNDSTPEWNHELPTSVYTTFAYADQPTGVSLKCMGCHEGLPDGPAVDEFGDAPTQTYYVSGEEAFGTDLTQHHPISFTYDDQHGGLNDPSGTPSGLTPNGTVDQDMLEEGRIECTSCHNQHDKTLPDYLVKTASEGLCFNCHKFDADPLTHHIPGRDDPWGDLREIAFNCTMCHGPDLAGDGLIPACTDCHN